MNHHFSHRAKVTEKPQGGGWQHKLKALIDQHNHMKANGTSVASNRTREERCEKLFQMFRTLRDKLNFKIEDPNNLKIKHIESLVKYWVEEGYAPATIDNFLSHLRLLCLWMKKPGMVKSLQVYAPEVKRTYAAKHDKSFVANDVDFWEVWEKVRAMDQYVAMQLLLIKAFGARRKEAVMFKPLIADRELYIELFEGTKGGRPRMVPVEDDFQRNVLATLKNFVASRLADAKGHIGDPDKDLEQI
ncbi:phage integrase N-terminal domain-containing protein [Undibacterium arcticum]|uniref:phage integrase N-terminal domain-containing protein n=1 Tax=Undibacterium arcticum TaxID=1762892 RepID=UPI00361A075B